MKVETILDQVDLGAMALPEFQRGYVWNREQVRGLMFSLYRKHPVGSLLVWVTKTEGAKARGDGNLAPGTVKLLLDGQQRITSLYGIIRGKPPKFFDGNAQAFTGLHFNLDDETFEFFMPMKMKDNPLWISVTELLQTGSGKMIQRLVTKPAFAAKLPDFINRLNNVDGIKQIDLHIEEVTGEDKSEEVVVDIFNRVNSGGTKLSQGDLALARICAAWPEARQEMKKCLDRWRKAGFFFRLELLLRVTNAIVTGQSLFTALKGVKTEDFKTGLKTAEGAVDKLLNMIASRLGLDDDQVLGSRYSFPLMARYLVQRGGKLGDAKERDRLLYWYIHTFLWGRYSGSTETVLKSDLTAIEGVTPNATGTGLKQLIENLRRDRANLKLTEADFRGSTKGARFYPLLYMMTRVCHARDWDTGDELTNHLLGHLSRLQVHHIFPKALLYENGVSKRDVNAIANFTFLTQETNLLVTKRDPAEYIPTFESKHPGVTATHWIPTDPELWKVKNYSRFLDERRRLLAAAANDFLEKLLAGDVPEWQSEGSILDRAAAPVPGRVEDEEEEQVLQNFKGWMAEQGLPEGEYRYELKDAGTGESLAVLDLAWPNGLQEGLSQPVALILEEGEEMEEMVNQAGYRFFTSVKALKEYVQKDILAEPQEDPEWYDIRKRFWTGLLNTARPKLALFANVSPGQHGWIGAGAGKRGLNFNFAVREHDAQVELYIDRGRDSDAENKAIFGQLQAHKADIEAAFGDKLEWQPLDDRRACRIRKVIALGGWRDEAKWTAVHEAAVDAMVRFERAIGPFVEDLAI